MSASATQGGHKNDIRKVRKTNNTNKAHTH